MSQISTPSRKTAPPLGEFELIARLCADLPQSRRTILGVGDDCAVLAASRHQQVITIDSMVEGVHFKLEWTPPEALGARALAVNLSDVAAMGATPTFCVVNLAIRPGLEARFFDRLYAGLRKAAADEQVDVVGGNITSADQLAITITLLGELQGGVMRRDRARPGDHIYVTGTLGDAALGLCILDGKVKARGAAREFLLGRFLNPTARVAAGRKLARIKPAPAAIDISDGLWQDLGHVLKRSGVGAAIDLHALPLSPAYRAVNGDDRQLALTGGEDYELLFCAKALLSNSAFTKKLGVQVTRIGRIVPTKGARLLEDGRPVADLPQRLAGWDQLRSARR